MLLALRFEKVHILPAAYGGFSTKQNADKYNKDAAAC
jgi:hypothetical protein